jgi:hypothetical protein
MRGNSILRFSLLFWLLPGATAVALQTDHIGESTRLADHPRILLFKGEEAKIKKALDSEAIWASVHRVILADCDALLKEAPVERILTGRRLLGKSREALRRIFFLSYAARMTGEDRYAKRAEQELLAVSRFADWNPSHFLDVAEMTMAMAIGYDWLHGILSSDTRHAVKEAIIHKGIEPSLDTRYSRWLAASHNWNQVCNAGMTYGALAIFEDQPELAKKVINRSIDSIPLPMADYAPDGAYPEGYGYWGYGTNFNVMFLSAIEKAFGTDFGLSGAPGFMKTAGYLQNMTGPSGDAFNYSDSALRGGLNPAMVWFANRLKEPSLLWVEKGYLSTGSIRHDRLLPAMLIWAADIGALDQVQPPSATFWTGGGKNPVALMRTSWTDPNAIFVGVKGGSPSVNHAHMDIGSFVMEADGTRWGMDFGAQDYNSLESRGINLWGKEQNSQRWDVFRYNNLVHNTLTIDGQYQRVSGFAPIIRVSADPRFMHAQVNLTQTYKDQVRGAVRGVAIVDGSYVVVRDEVQTLGRAAQLRWTLLTAAQVEITGSSSAQLTLNGRKLTLEVQEPEGVTMKTWSTVPMHDYDAPNPGTSLVGFEMSLPANADAAVTVLLIPEKVKARPAPKVRALSDWP